MKNYTHERINQQTPDHRNFGANKVAASMAGNLGDMGDEYHAVWFSIAYYPDGVIEVRAKYGTGRNNGVNRVHGGRPFLYEKDSRTAKRRGFNLDDTCADLLKELLTINCGPITKDELAMALNVSRLHAEDMISSAPPTLQSCADILLGVIEGNLDPREAAEMMREKGFDEQITKRLVVC